MTHAANLPRHLYVKCDMEFVSDGEKQGIEDAVWFGLTAIPGQRVGAGFARPVGRQSYPAGAARHGDTGGRAAAHETVSYRRCVRGRHV